MHNMDHFHALMRTNLLLILLSFVHATLLYDLVCAFPSSYNLCSTTNSCNENSPFQKNLNDLLRTLPSNASFSKFYNTSIGNETDHDGKVFALYMCLNFVSSETCRYCITLAQADTTRFCPSSKEAIVYEEYCQLRYCNDNFFGKLDVSENLPLGNVQNISDPEKFSSVVNKTLRNLANSAAFNSSNMYAVGAPYKDKNICAFVQCTLDLSPYDCSKCLERATQDVLRKLFFSTGARLLSPSCYLRYELYPIDRNGSDPMSSPPDNSNIKDNGRKIWRITILTVGSACLAVAFFGSCAHYHAVNKRKKRNYPKAEFPHVDLSTIHAATNSFSDSNKLGQGGFGPVYKGVLDDGRGVAVKRLSIGSEQGSKEFTNEVLLIM